MLQTCLADCCMLCAPSRSTADPHLRLATRPAAHQAGLQPELQQVHHDDGQRAGRREAHLRPPDGGEGGDGPHGDPQEHAGRVGQHEVGGRAARTHHQPNEPLQTARPPVSGGREGGNEGGMV